MIYEIFQVKKDFWLSIFSSKNRRPKLKYFFLSLLFYILIFNEWTLEKEDEKMWYYSSNYNLTTTSLLTDFIPATLLKNEI